MMAENKSEIRNAPTKGVTVPVGVSIDFGFTFDTNTVDIDMDVIKPVIGALNRFLYESE